jgi:hypothetical protein
VPATARPPALDQPADRTLPSAVVLLLHFRDTSAI